MRDATELRPSPADAAELERWLAPARAALDAGAAAVAGTEGRAMTLEQAVAYAMEDAPAAA